MLAKPLLFLCVGHFASAFRLDIFDGLGIALGLGLGGAVGEDALDHGVELDAIDADVFVAVRRDADGAGWQEAGQQQQGHARTGRRVAG